MGFEGLNIVILNGAFGAGKTAVAREFLRLRPNWMLFDPEEVGFMVRTVCADYLKECEETGDFQDIEMWAPLVVHTAAQLISSYRRSLVVPMTLVARRPFELIKLGFEGIARTHHFALTATPETLRKRLADRGDGEGSWPEQQIPRCVTALCDLHFSIHLDTEGASVIMLAEAILAHVESSANP